MSTWEVKNTTTKNGITTATVEYKDGSTVIATLTGIKGGLKETTLNSGISVNNESGTITLSSSVLTNSDVELTVGKNSYKLNLFGTDVVEPTDIEPSFSNGTLTLTGTLTRGYKLASSTKVTFSVEKTGQELAKITGLDPSLTKTSDNKIVASGGEEAVIVGDGVITLKGAALTNSEVKFKNNAVGYTFALDDINSPGLDVDTGKWTFATSKGTTTATYTCDVGNLTYTLSLDDKTVNYTEDAEEVAVFAINGVSSEVTAETADDYFEVAVISDDTHHYAATVTLKQGALTNKNLSVTKPGYQIVLGEDVQKTETTTNEWFVSDGKTNATATYKTITPEYYTYDESNNTVTYTKQADVKTLATVKNLVKGLVVGTDEETGNSALLTSNDDVAVTVDNSGVITVQEGALNSGNVTLTNGTNESYSLALGEGIDAPGVVNDDNLKWSVKGTTATLSGKTTAGYAKTNDTTITYVAADKTVDFVKVAGLASGVLVPKTGNYSGLVGMNEKNSEGKTIFVQGLSADTYNPEEGGGTITISADVLGTNTATITPAAGYTYSFALDDGTVNTAGEANGKAVPTSKKTKHFWNIRGSSLLLKNGYANYYTLADSTTITQTDQVIGSDVAVVTGLKSGLKVNTDGSIDGITVSGTQITLTKAVLDKKDVEFSSNLSGYKFAIADSLKPTAGSKLWLLNDTTAQLVEGTSAGYTPQSSNSVLKYSKAVAGDTLATITGLKSGLKLEDDWIDGITVGDPETSEEESGNVVVSNDEEETEGKTITLFKEVLGTTDVELDSVGLKNGYTLAIGSTAPTATVTPGWTSTTKGKAVYTEKVTKKGFEEKNYEPSEQEDPNLADSVYKLAYMKNNITTKITGLKDSLTKAELAEALTEAEVAPNNDGVITLPEEVLGTKTVKISGSSYTLALDEGIDGPVVNSYTWVPDTKNKTKATLTGDVETAGYTVSEDNLSIFYTPVASNSTLATITGLKSGLTATELASGISDPGSGTELALKSSVLGGTKLTISDGIYTLALDKTDEDIHTEAEPETNWITNGTTATYKSYMSEYYTPNAKGTVITYTKPTAGTTYATVKGIAKGVDISSGFSGNTKGGTINLNSDMLGASNVTLTGSGFKLALVEEGSGKVLTSATNATEWVTNGTTATYKNYTKAWYKKDSDTKITYKAPDKGTTYATITGLANGATITDSNLTKTDNGTIVTLNENQLAKKKVTISGSSYTLALGEISSDSLATSYGKYWTQAANKTDLYYKEDFTPGYDLAADSKSITYSTKDKTVELAKLSNVAKATEVVDTRTKLYDDTDNPTKITGYDYTDSAKLDGLTVDDDAKTIAFTSNSLIPNKDADTKKDNAKITLSKTSDYSFVIDEDGDFKEPAIDGDPSWTIVKNSRTEKATGVLTYDQGYTEGVTITDGKTATYSIAKDNTLATISNLNADALDELSDSFVATLTANGISVSGTKILLTSTDLLNESAKKKITLGKNDSFEFDASAIAPTAGVNKWAVKGTTATYNSTLTDGFKATDTKTVSYVKESVDEAIFTITGLKKGLKVSNDGTKIGALDSTAKDVTADGITVRNDNKIELKNAVLGTTNIQLTNNGDTTYTISDVAANEPGDAKSVWSYSKGTATYKKTQNSGYTLDSNGLNVTYTAAKTTTLATLKGLNTTFKGILEYAIKTEGEIITVGKDLLSTSTITLTVPKGGTDYSLELGDGIAQQAATVSGKWVTSNSTAKYQSYQDAYYAVDPQTGKKILYYKPTNVTTYATIDGIKSGVDINSASGVTDGTVGGTVTLTADMLTTKSVKVTVPKTNSSANYTLAIANGVPTSSENTTEWVTSGTTAVYKTYNKGSYKVENNKVAYTAGNNPKGSVTEFATIKGASSDITATLSSNTFIISGSELSNNVSVTSAATTAGTSDYAFSFNDDYNNSAITGSANKDTITAEGDRLSVTGGKGDDEIIFGENSRVGNFFIYAKNDGNDTIANFKAGDALKISGTINSIAPDGEGIVISIGSGNTAGSITLQDCSLETITVNGKDSLTGVESSDLLVDNNYSMDAAKLSSIVEPASVALTPYDYSTSFGLTKEDVFIAATTYAKDK